MDTRNKLPAGTRAASLTRALQLPIWGRYVNLADTHWVGGHVLVALGVVILVCTFLSPSWLGKLVAAGVATAFLALAALSYWNWRSRRG